MKELSTFAWQLSRKTGNWMKLWSESPLSDVVVVVVVDVLVELFFSTSFLLLLHQTTADLYLGVTQIVILHRLFNLLLSLSLKHTFSLSPSLFSLSLSLPHTHYIPFQSLSSLTISLLHSISLTPCISLSLPPPSLSLSRSFFVYTHSSSPFFVAGK